MRLLGITVLPVWRKPRAHYYRPAATCPLLWPLSTDLPRSGLVQRTFGHSWIAVYPTPGVPRSQFLNSGVFDSSTE